MAAHESWWTAFGRVPLALAIVGGFAWVGYVVHGKLHKNPRPPDLVFSLASISQAASHRPAIENFERLHNVKVQVVITPLRTSVSRLKAAIDSGENVPDLVALVEPNLGQFTKGRAEDIPFVDLTDRVDQMDLRHRMVASRFTMWTRGGRIYAIPRDVHPTGLAYRTDIAEQYGIHPETFTTWDRFAEEGRSLRARRRAQGESEVFLMHLEAQNSLGLPPLILQAGGRLIEENGTVRLDDPITQKVVAFFAEGIAGAEPFIVDAGVGQSFSRSLVEGRVVFFLCPDWFAKTLELQLVPELRGKFRLIPLPAWTNGGRRTTTIGGSGFAITKHCENPDLAWELIKAISLDPANTAREFPGTYVTPCFRDAWSAEELQRPNPYFSGQPIGKFFQELAPDIPENASHQYETTARTQLADALQIILERIRADRTRSTSAIIAEELHRAAETTRLLSGRNRLTP